MLDPFSIAAIASTGVNLLGGMLGNKTNKQQEGAINAAARGFEHTSKDVLDLQRGIYNDQLARLDQLRQQYGSTMPPNLLNMIPQLENFVLSGEMTPDQANAYLVEQSAAMGVKPPRELVEKQYETLNQLQRIGTEGGLTAMDKAQLEEIRGQVAADEKAARGALQQQAAERGITGSGMELAGRMMAQQGAAERGSKMATDVAALAQKRAMDALAQTGQLSTNMRGQDVQEQMDRANALDAIAKFNAQMKGQTELANVDARNRAQAANLAAKQDILNRNVEQRNAQRMMPITFAQQDYENKQKQLAGLRDVAGMQGQAGQAFGNQASAQLNAAAELAKQQTANAATVAQNKSKNTSGVLGSIGKLVGGIFSHEDTKTDIKPMGDEDISAILDQLVPRSFKYKGPEFGPPGPMSGVIIEEMGPAAKEHLLSPDGEVIESKKATSLALAALANLNDRVGKLEGAK